MLIEKELYILFEREICMRFETEHEKKKIEHLPIVEASKLSPWGVQFDKQFEEVQAAQQMSRQPESIYSDKKPHSILKGSQIIETQNAYYQTTPRMTSNRASRESTIDRNEFNLVINKCQSNVEHHIISRINWD